MEDLTRPRSGVDAGASRRPVLVVFDVNETLSNLAPLGDRFEEVGASRHLARVWFAGVLRDGFARTAVGDSEAFTRIAAENLRTELHGSALDRDVDRAVEHVMAGFRGLDVHPDVAEGVRALRGQGVRLVTLSNGAAAIAEGLLQRAGLRAEFDRILSVEDAGVWKPAPDAYAWALEQCGTRPEDAMLVAVHPWDIDGAARAGLATTWVSRTGAPYPGHFSRPDLTVASLPELADRLAGRSGDRAT